MTRAATLPSSPLMWLDALAREGGGVRWLVFENVPGLLSSESGRDFGAFLGLLGECGYGYAWRILDAQYFGVPQRRRRVLLVGYLGDWRRAAAVLFEPESLRGDPPPRRETGARAAGALAGVSPGGGWRVGADEAAAGQLVAGALGAAKGGADDNDAQANRLVVPPLVARSSRGGATPLSPGFNTDQHIVAAFGCNNTAGAIEVAGALNASHTASGRQDFESETFIAAVHENQRAEITLSDTAGSLKTGGGKPGQGYPAVAFNWQSGGDGRGLDPRETSGCLTKEQTPATLQGMSVRRLTPTECERLQGFPDGWTAIAYRGKPAADGPRYKALGNSMARPKLEWILARLVIADVAARAA
jgi:DNA (cytosine-5)-methyltransferase 1